MKPSQAQRTPLIALAWLLIAVAALIHVRPVLAETPAPPSPLVVELSERAVNLLVDSPVRDIAPGDVEIRHIELRPDAAKLEVLVTSRHTDFSYQSPVTIYALIENTRIIAMFSEPSEDFYRYAERVPADLLLRERIDYWRELQASEQALDTNSQYRLPFTGGEKRNMTRGPTQHGYDAWDFGGADWLVRAIRGGEVTSVVEGYSSSCAQSGCVCTEECKTKANLVKVQHSDGTSATYVHLRKDGAIVKVGDKVSQGTCLGYTGNTGCSCGAHLHARVEVVPTITWYEAPSDDPSLKKLGETPASQNSRLSCTCCGGGCSASNQAASSSSAFGLDYAALFRTPASREATAPGIADTSQASEEPVAVPPAPAWSPRSQPLTLTATEARAAPATLAQPTAAHYAIPNSVLASGGGAKSSASYRMTGTAGQATGVGRRESASYRLHSGYWSAPACLAAGLAPAPKISVNGTAVALAWSAVPGASGYSIYRGTTPYFAPGTPFASTTGTQWTDPSGGGDPLVNHTYVVDVANACSRGTAGQRVGEFDFALTR